MRGIYFDPAGNLMIHRHATRTMKLLRLTGGAKYLIDQQRKKV